MRKKFFSSMLVLSLVINVFSALSVSATVYPEPDTSDWAVWETPNDIEAFGSAIDASYVLDKPAGKHGFAKADGENIVFDDGTNVSFWGTTLCMQACFPDYDEAEIIADRIARAGYNIVRFHHMDWTSSAAPSIFSETGVVSNTLEINKIQQDKLFYLLSCLKERGIYYYIDLIVTRSAYKEDGITDYQTIGRGWGSEKFFDRKLIELQKNYANQLLNTENPYTGLTLAKDPAMIFVDINNESSMFSTYMPSMSDYYKNQLNALYNEFLKKKYPPGNLLSSDQKLKLAWGSKSIQSGQSLDDGTITLGECTIPGGYTDLGYSQQRIDDTYEFLYETVKAYYIEMKLYLNDTLGVKCLITGTGMGGANNDVMATAYLNKEVMDYTDAHIYQSHPTNGMDVGSYSYIETAVKFPGMPYAIHGHRVYNQPFVIGEWNKCNTNDFRAEANMYMAFTAKRQNWNLFHFNLASTEYKDEDRITTPFQSWFDPAYTTTAPMAAMIFHRDGIEEDPDNYYTAVSKDDALNAKTAFTRGWDFGGYKTGTMFKEFDDYDASKCKKPNNTDPDVGYAANIKTAYTNSGIFFSETDSAKTNSYPYCDITVNNDFGVVGLTSVGFRPLEDTDRMLLTAIGKARNTGFTLENERIVSLGTTPLLADTIDGKVVIKDKSSDFAVYALDTNGNRIQSVPVTKDSNGYSTVELSKSYKAFNYEVVRKSSSFVTLNAYSDKKAKSVVVKGFTSPDKAGKTVSLSFAKKSDLSNVVYAVDAYVDSLGNYKVTTGSNLPSGDYIVTASSGDSVEYDEVNNNMNNYNLSVDVNYGGENVLISGSFMGQRLPASDKNVALLVKNTESVFSEPAITAENINAAAFSLNQTKTDEDGNFYFSVDMTGARSGVYNAVISGDVGGKAYRYSFAFRYTNNDLPQYSLHFYSDRNKVSQIKQLTSGDKITVVAETTGDAQDAALALAIYKDDRFVDVIFNKDKRNDKHELYIDYTLPKNTSGYKLSAFLVDSYENMKPFTEKVSLTEENK